MISHLTAEQAQEMIRWENQRADQLDISPSDLDDQDQSIDVYRLENGLSRLDIAYAGRLDYTLTTTPVEMGSLLDSYLRDEQEGWLPAEWFHAARPMDPAAPERGQGGVEGDRMLATADPAYLERMGSILHHDHWDSDSKTGLDEALDQIVYDTVHWPIIGEDRYGAAYKQSDDYKAKKAFAEKIRSLDPHDDLNYGLAIRSHSNGWMSVNIYVAEAGKGGNGNDTWLYGEIGKQQDISDRLGMWAHDIKYGYTPAEWTGTVTKPYFRLHDGHAPKVMTENITCERTTRSDVANLDEQLQQAAEVAMPEEWQEYKEKQQSARENADKTSKENRARSDGRSDKDRQAAADLGQAIALIDAPGAKRDEAVARIAGRMDDLEYRDGVIVNAMYPETTKNDGNAFHSALYDDTSLPDIDRMAAAEKTLLLAETAKSIGEAAKSQCDAVIGLWLWSTADPALDRQIDRLAAKALDRDSGNNLARLVQAEREMGVRPRHSPLEGAKKLDIAALQQDITASRDEGIRKDQPGQEEEGPSL